MPQFRQLHTPGAVSQSSRRMLTATALPVSPAVTLSLYRRWMQEYLFRNKYPLYSDIIKGRPVPDGLSADRYSDRPGAPSELSEGALLRIAIKCKHGGMKCPDTVISYPEQALCGKTASGLYTHRDTCLNIAKSDYPAAKNTGQNRNSLLVYRGYLW